MFTRKLHAERPHPVQESNLGLFWFEARAVTAAAPLTVPHFVFEFLPLKKTKMTLKSVQKHACKFKNVAQKNKQKTSILTNLGYHFVHFVDVVLLDTA